MHYASHILIHCIALSVLMNEGRTARSAVSPEILANFAKNVASVISPAIVGEAQSRSNRSSFYRSILAVPTSLAGSREDQDSPSALDNIVDKTSNAGNYYKSQSDSYPYNGLYEDSSEGLEVSRVNEGLEESLRDESYRQEQPNFYDRPYGFLSNNDNFGVTPKSTDSIDNIQSSIGNIEESPSNRYASYRGTGLHKVGFAQEPFLGKPYGGFHGFGPYGHFHGYHHHHPYHNGGHRGDDGSGEATPEENARQESNGTNRSYGPYFNNHGYGHHHGYSPFSYGGHGGYGGYGGYNPYYGPHRGSENDSSADGQNYGPYHGSPDFYGPPGYGHNNGYDYGYNRNNKQTEEPADSGDQNNSTKNGYPHAPYGPPLLKPFLGAFHLHGFPPLPPYDHFHFKAGPVAGVGHAGYPIYADPFLIGFPFHYPYGPFFHGKHNKYLPPKGKPSSGESGEQTEAPAELAGDEDPGRITTLNEEEVAPAPSSNRYKTSQRKEAKRVDLINFESRKV